MHRIDYSVTDLDFIVRTGQTHRDPTARVIVGCHDVDLSASRPQDRGTLYLGVDAFDWSSYWWNHLIGFPTPTALIYYCNLVPRPNGAQRHWVQVIAFT